MIEIKDLLLKFNNILSSEESKINLIKEALNKILKLEIKNTDIEIKNNSVYLNIKPIYKNEVFLHQDEISSFLEENLGKRAPKNFR